MNIYRLDKKIEIQKRTSDTDTIGNIDNEWTEYYTCHASTSSFSSREEEKNAEVIQVISCKFTVRSCELVNALFNHEQDYRIEWDDRVWNIKSVDPVENNHKWYVVLECERGVNGHKN